VQIKCGKSEFKVAGQGTEEFPTLREYDFKGAVTVPFDFVKTMIDRVSFAITMDDPRYAIHGALFIVRKGSLEMVSTDGHRLSYVKKQADVAPKEEIRVIVPSKMLAEIVKLEPGPEGEMKIGLKENHIFVRTGLRTIQGSLFEGTFPNFEKVMPVGNDKVVRCATGSLLDALKRVSLLSAERTKAVKLAIDEGKLVVSTSNPEFGEAEETVDIEGYKGKGIEIGFNARYLIDFLQVLGTEEVLLELKDGETQGMLKPADEQGTDYRYVVMPMRI
jgi:DNA polymerase-3 subunit beta